MKQYQMVEIETTCRFFYVRFVTQCFVVPRTSGSKAGVPCKAQELGFGVVSCFLLHSLPSFSRTNFTTEQTNIRPSDMGTRSLFILVNMAVYLELPSVCFLTCGGAPRRVGRAEEPKPRCGRAPPIMFEIVDCATVKAPVITVAISWIAQRKTK